MPVLVRSTGTEHGVCGARYARGARGVRTEAGWGHKVYEVWEQVRVLARGAGTGAFSDANAGTGCWNRRGRGAGTGHKDACLSAKARVETVRPLTDVQLWMFNQVSKAYVHKARQFKRVHFKL